MEANPSNNLVMTWHVEVVDSGPEVGNHTTSIGIDPWEGIHISYYDAVNTALKYANKPAGGAWETSFIQHGEVVGRENALVVDSVGTAHVVYLDEGNKVLIHASKPFGGEWSYYKIMNITLPKTNPSLTLDTSDTLHLIFCDQWTGRLWYGRKFIGDPWELEEVRKVSPKSLGDTAIAIESDGTIHVVWKCGAWDVLNATMSNGTWHFGKNPIATGLASRLEMVVSKDGTRNVIISFDHLLKIATWVPSNGRWYLSTNSPMEAEHMWRDGAIATNERGISVVCALSPVGGLSYYRTTDINSHRHGSVDGISDISATSITSGPRGRFHIAYHDPGNGSLKYATDWNLPDGPTKVIAEGGEVFVRITWEPPDYIGNATHVKFNIYKSTRPALHTPTLFQENITGTRFIDMDVLRKDTYHYWVAAVNYAGEGRIVGPVDGVPTRIPTPPLNLTAMTGRDWIQLAWEPPDRTEGREIVGYRVYWKYGEKKTQSWYSTPLYPTQRSDEGNITLVADTLSYNHTGISQRDTLSYWVCTLHSGGEGEITDRVWATAMEVPGPISNLTHGRGEGNVSLTWHHPEDDGGCKFTEYRVYRGSTKEHMELIGNVRGANGWGDWILPRPGYRDTRRPINETYYSDNITYYYAIRAVNLQGEGLISEVVEVRPFGTPSRPLNVSAIHTSKGVLVKWIPPLLIGTSDIQSYNVYRWTADNPSDFLGSIENGSLSHLDVDLVSGTDYWYAVTAVNQYGEGYISEPAFIYVEPTFIPPSIENDEKPWWTSYLLWVLVTIFLVFLIFMFIIFKGMRSTDP